MSSTNLSRLRSSTASVGKPSTTTSNEDDTATPPSCQSTLSTNHDYNNNTAAASSKEEYEKYLAGLHDFFQPKCFYLDPYPIGLVIHIGTDYYYHYIITRVVSESTAKESTYIVTSVEDGKEYHVDGKDVNVPHGVLFCCVEDVNRLQNRIMADAGVVWPPRRRKLQPTPLSDVTSSNVVTTPSSSAKTTDSSSAATNTAVTSTNLAVASGAKTDVLVSPSPQKSTKRNPPLKIRPRTSVVVSENKDTPVLEDEGRKKASKKRKKNNHEEEGAKKVSKKRKSAENKSDYEEDDDAAASAIKKRGVQHARWDGRFAELKDYMAEHGNTDVPRNYANNPQLGNWVNVQRKQYSSLKKSGARSTMTDEMIAKLEGIGFKWNVQVEWDGRFAELKDYMAEHGNTDVPRNYANNPQLGNWVNVQRKQYRLKKLGAQSSMTDERIAKLEGIGFNWVLQERVEWDDRWVELKAYNAEHGNTDVPKNYANNPQLGSWVNVQRKLYRLKKLGAQSSMTDERIAKLEGIGFNWVLREQVEWDDRWVELKAYNAEHGNTDVPKNYANNPQLGSWVNDQRKLYRLKKLGAQSSMTGERIAKLEDIGFNWDRREKAWNDMFKDLVKYKEKNGNTRVKVTDNAPLYHWCTRQRQLDALVNDSNESLLQPERKMRLDEIGFDFYRRQSSQRESRIEWKMMHELIAILEDLGLEWHSLDQVFGALRFRPDGVLILEIDSFVIFVEIDERSHNPTGKSYTVSMEKEREESLKKEANRLGMENVVFIRINTGNLTQVSPKQLVTIGKVLKEICFDKPAGCSIHYVDYDEDHVHVQASIESMKEALGFIDNVKINHSEYFDGKATKLTAKDIH